MAANKDKGLIYILTNPSFQSYQKIGMTMNETAEERIVAGLNKASCLPFSFRVYATYTVNGDKRSVEMVEEEIHKIIDAVNDTLRARENVGKAKAREREFFLITPDKAYSLFESIATLRGDKESNLRLIAPTKAQADEAAVAEAAEQSIQERQKKQKTVTQYFADTTDELKALYTKVEQFILDLGDVEKKINDNYIAFKKSGNNAICVEVNGSCVILRLKLDANSFSFEKNFSRNMFGVGHFGTGDVEIRIKSVSDFEKAKPFLQQAYDEN